MDTFILFCSLCSNLVDMNLGRILTEFFFGGGGIFFFLFRRRKNDGKIVYCGATAVDLNFRRNHFFTINPGSSSYTAETEVHSMMKFVPVI